ncbi:MAG: hypothetical protein JKY70_11700 [Mucilaginibacter sp.]|nr:hypothetical protein [Mucilaginibacter sp.]
MLGNPRKIGISLATLSIAGGIIWMISGLLYPQCMYWTGSEYKAVSCTIHAPGRAVYAIDIRRLDHFKKIMKPDTITAVSVGRVWYFKTGHQLELFTDSGMHPVLTNRRLKPLTPYMQEKYLSKKPADKTTPDLVVTDKRGR